MQVIASPDVHLQTLISLSEWSNHVDLVFAWAHSQHGTAEHWKAINLLKVRRAVIGTEFARTEPYALAELNKVPERLRVVINETGVFHPKLIMGFRGDSCRVLLGSANFTGAAYTTNVELGILIEGKRSDLHIGELMAFVDQCWEQGTRIDDAWLIDYEKAYQRAARQPIVPIPRAALDITSITSLAMSWEDYLTRINGQEGREAGPDFKISVRGSSPSYFDELDATSRLFERGANFKDLDLQERYQLMGIGARSNGLLGTMRAAGFAKGVARSQPNEIGRTLDKLPLTGQVSLETVGELLNEITSIKGIKLGVATRLFAVKRPDLFVSVNNGSNPQLAQLLGGRSITKVRDYLQLLRLVWDTDWHKSPRPSASADAAIWDRRAALLDAALYQVVQH